jgi:hypothetical protein
LNPAAGGPPTFVCSPTTDDTGVFVCTGFAPGSYVACVKHNHALQTCASATLIPGTNSIDFGTLLEGDADNNNCVQLVDFSKLVTSFALCSGDPNFDPQTDFDDSGCVVLIDFSLLASNFGQCGDEPPEPP